MRSILHCIARCSQSLPTAVGRWPEGPVGHPFVMAICRRKPFGQGSATAWWARTIVLVCKANCLYWGKRPRTSSAPCGGTFHGPNRPVLTGKCPLDIFPGARTPRGEGIRSSWLKSIKKTPFLSEGRVIKRSRLNYFSSEKYLMVRTIWLT